MSRPSLEEAHPASCCRVCPLCTTRLVLLPSSRTPGRVCVPTPRCRPQCIKTQVYTTQPRGKRFQLLTPLPRPAQTQSGSLTPLTLPAPHPLPPGPQGGPLLSPCPCLPYPRAVPEPHAFWFHFSPREAQQEARWPESALVSGSGCGQGCMPTPAWVRATEAPLCLPHCHPPLIPPVTRRVEGQGPNGCVRFLCHRESDTLECDLRFPHPSRPLVWFILISGLLLLMKLHPLHSLGQGPRTLSMQ